VATQNADGSSHDWLDDVWRFEVVDARQMAGVANLRAQIEWQKNRRRKSAHYGEGAAAARATRVAGRMETAYRLQTGGAAGGREGERSVRGVSGDARGRGEIARADCVGRDGAE